MATVDAGSLSGASRRLGMPLATVSRRVSELERRLKTRLLNRSSRKLALTDAGRLYVASCRRILDDVEDAERAASGEYSAPRGELTLTVPIVFGRLHVLPVVVDFLKAYPDIDIRMLLSDRVAALQEEHLDLAVRVGHLPDSSLVATRVGSIRRMVCASPAYLAARGTPRRPADLGELDCITYEGLVSPGRWVFTTRKAEIAVATHSRLTVTTAEAAIDAAIAGLGIVRALSYQVADAIDSGKLVAALTDFEPPPWPVHLLFSGQRLLPQKLRAFLDFATPRLRAALSR